MCESCVFDHASNHFCIDYKRRIVFCWQEWVTKHKYVITGLQQCPNFLTHTIFLSIAKKHTQKWLGEEEIKKMAPERRSHIFGTETATPNWRQRKDAYQFLSFYPIDWMGDTHKHFVPTRDWKLVSDIHLDFEVQP